MTLLVGQVCKELMSYQDAVVYCLFYNEHGHVGWRLPTKAEYMTTPTMKYGWMSDLYPPFNLERDGIRQFTPVKDI